MTPSDERDLLFRRLAAAAGKRPAAPPPPAGENAPAPFPEGDRVARFAKAFAEAGGVLYRGPAESALHDLGEALRTEGVTALFSPEGDGAARRVAEDLAPFGPFTLISCAEVRGETVAAAAGFRTAEAGIAETGTVVETSAGGRPLSPGLLADVQVWLLPVSSLFDSLDEALASLCAAPTRDIAFRTGPSRTPDIEQTFAPGVLGPRKVIVLLS